MELNEALNVLQSLVNYERGFQKYNAGNYQPDRVRRMFDEQGEDISPLRFFHVAGTNGKGSVSSAIADLLSASGRKTGLYTSPHLFSPLERIRIAGNDIDRAYFCALVERYIGYFREMAATYFEAFTFLAVKAFLENGCEYAVLETGLGGRLDSTNFCNPLVSTITPVGFDHTKLLGSTLGQIAGEKAGIIKRDTPVVVGRQKDEARDALLEKAKEMNAPVYLFDDTVGYTIKERNLQGSVFDAAIILDGRIRNFENVRFDRMGDVLVENFLLAVITLLAAGIRVDDFAFREAALKHQRFRMECYKSCLIDVAHNPSALEALSDTLEKYAPGIPKRLYVGVLADKEIRGMAETLDKMAGQFDRVTIYDFETFDGKRPSGGKELFGAMNRHSNLAYLSDFSGIQLESSYLNVFTGSFYSVGAVIRLIDSYSARQAFVSTPPDAR